MGAVASYALAPPNTADGFITAPERPGHGLRFKEEVRRDFGGLGTSPAQNPIDRQAMARQKAADLISTALTFSCEATSGLGSSQILWLNNLSTRPSIKLHC